MTKADVITQISKETNLPKLEVSKIVESFLIVVKDSMTQGNNIYVRGFGSFINKKKARKTGRIVLSNTPIVIPEHYVPWFKPCPEFKKRIKKSKKVKLKNNSH